MTPQSSTPPHIRFTPMTISDLVTVDVLEQLCFPTPWSMTTYRRELQHNRFSHYWVVRPPLMARPSLQQSTPSSNGTAAAAFPPILAYGGYWMMDEDAHIATIASHPEWRGRGIGKWLLLNMLAQARQHGACNATLEVRVSNNAAQKLYLGLGFERVGKRKGYYPPTKLWGLAEDALLLTLYGLDDGQIWRGLQREHAALNSALLQSLRDVQPQ